MCTTNGPGFCDIALEILCRFLVLSIFQQKKVKKWNKMLLHKVCHIHFFKLILSCHSHSQSFSFCVYSIPLLLLFENVRSSSSCTFFFGIFTHSVLLHPKSVVTVFRSHFHAIFRGYTLQLDYKQRKSHVHSLELELAPYRTQANGIWMKWNP